MRRQLIYGILSVAVLALSIVPIGTAVFYLGFVHGDSPCVMCWEQRTGMALIALTGLFLLRYGPKPKYIGLATLIGAWGIFMGMRHAGMHAARDLGQGFSLEILGAHTYTWALFIYWVCVVTMGVLLTMMKEGDFAEPPRSLSPLGRLAMVVYLVVIAANAVQAFASTGPPPFMGQGDPVRFSFSPKHWVWSLEEYSPARVRLRGRWSATKPGLADLSADPAGGPLAGLATLPVREQRQIQLPLRGTVTDLSYEPSTDRFLLSTQSGIYIVDSTLTRVLRYTIVDPGYSVDLGRFAGAAFLDPSTVMAVGENKSFVILHENDKADSDRNFRYFLESFDRFDEVSRSRLGTIRARMMYTMSLAFDPASDSLYTVTVPNSEVRRLVVSRFDRRDLTLSEEFGLTLSPDSGLTLAGTKRSLDEFYVTGTALSGGRMYAISAAYSTLLAIDPAKRAIVGAYAIPGLSHPTGLAIRGRDLYIIGDGGRLAIVGTPAAASTATEDPQGRN